MTEEDAFPEAQMPEKGVQLVVDDSATTHALVALAKQMEWVRRHLGAVEAKVEALQNAGDVVVKKSDTDWTSVWSHYHNTSNIEPRIAALEHDTMAELTALKQELQDLARRQEEQALKQQQQQQEAQQEAQQRHSEPEAQLAPERDDHANGEALRQLQEAVRELQASHDAGMQQVAARLEESKQAHVRLHDLVTERHARQEELREQLELCNRKGEVLEEQLEALQQQLMKLHQQVLQPTSQPTAPQVTAADNELLECLQQQVATLEGKIGEHSRQLAEAERKLERASQNNDNGASRLAGLYRRLDQHDQMLNDLHDMARSQQHQVPNNLMEEMELMRSNVATLQAATAKIHGLEESKEELSERLSSAEQSLAKLASSWLHIEPELKTLGDRATDCDARIHDLDAKLNARSQLNREAEAALREESKRLDQYATALDSLCKDVLEIDERFKTKLHDVARKFENQLEYTAGWIVKQVKHQIAKRAHEKDVDATDFGRTRCIVCDNPVMKMRRHTPFEPDPFLTKMKPKQLPTSAEDLDLLRQNSPPRERLLEDKLKQKPRPATAHPTRGRYTKILTRINSVITTQVTDQPKHTPDELEERAHTPRQHAQEPNGLKPIIPIPDAERPTTAPVVHFDARKHAYA